MTQKAELCSMTWKECEEAFARKPVILLPMGSIEEHGPHTPVGDYRYMTVVSRLIAEQSGAISAPTIPWGYSEYFKHFPGCLTLQPETLKALLFDTLDGFLRFGIDHLVFVCGHKGNMSILEQVARTVKERHGIRMATVEPLGWITPDFRKQIYGTEQLSTGHGSDPMCSIAMELFPEDVRMDLAEAGSPSRFWGLKMQGMASADFEGFPVSIYCDMDEVTPNGVLGDPFIANREVGRKCVQRMVEVGVRFVNWFARQDTRCERAGAQ